MLPNLPNSLKKADMDNELWIILLPIILLPVFFTMGWFAARVDMKTVLKQAKSIPSGFYKSLDALVDRNSGRAARELAEVVDYFYRNRMI